MTWTGTILLFSGRPDPTWAVPPSIVRSLERAWDRSAAYPGPPPAAPPLGYRGCLLKSPDLREWLAYGGAVTLRTAGQAESRRDPGRSFERTLLASAPPKAVPASLIEALEPP
ncbi:MAG TPA: hypothetical protein VKZ50_14895 [bacterium]|nr:hypothetical protein [bacterium]